MRGDNVKSVDIVEKQFLCCVPIKNIQWNDIFTHLDWINQEILINNTVNLATVRRYPIKINYQLTFLKYLIKNLEKEGSDINDCLYDAVGRLVALDVNDQKECYKHYTLKEEKVIIVKENPNIISQGTTGLCSWQAGIALSEWCIENTNIFKNKTVLELGSGVGLTGLVIALNCQPKKYYFTDCHQTVLNNIVENVLLNLKHDSVHNNDNSIPANDVLLNVPLDNTNLEVINLSWEDIDVKVEIFKEVDYLLAADVVYDSSLFDSLLNGIKCFLLKSFCKKAYIACTERDKSTLKEFLCLLDSYQLKCKKLPLAKQNIFYWDTEVPIRLLEVTI